MKSDFLINNIPYYKIQDQEVKPILYNLEQTAGVFKIPKEIVLKDLKKLSSPIQSPDFIACFTSGPIPTSTAATATSLDTIRKESNLKCDEPDYNVYKQHIVKTQSSYYISGPIPLDPDEHWPPLEKIQQVYNLDEI